MGSLILCHRKRAKHPYEITRVHMHIHTIEELCYYFCNNLYLIDYTIVNRQLCDWLEDELALYELAEELRGQLHQQAPMEQFVLTILSSAFIYSSAEITKIQNVLRQLKNQNEVEKEKYKADNLIKTGEYGSAIRVYQSIVNKEWDETLDLSFYGNVYACLGAAYGKMLLYGEASEMYEKAFKMNHDQEMLKVFIYCCYRSMTREDYVKMLSKESAYLSIDSGLKKELKKAEEQLNPDIKEEKYEKWRREYRRIDKT